MPPTDWTDPQNIIAIGTTLVAIFAFVISCVSIILAKKTLEQQQKHDRLSVRPIGIFELFDGKDEIRIWLHNQGTGPMIIKSVEMFNERGQKEKDRKGNFKNYPIDWLDQNNRRGVEFRTHLENVALINGPNPFRLLYYKLDPTDSNQREQRDNILVILKNLKIKMNYTDIYNELQDSSAGTLNFFGRTRFD